MDAASREAGSIMTRKHCPTPDCCRAPKKQGRCPCEVTDKWREAMRKLHSDPAFTAKKAIGAGRPRIYPEGTMNLRRKLRHAGIKGDALREAIEAMQ